MKQLLSCFYCTVSYQLPSVVFIFESMSDWYFLCFNIFVNYLQSVLIQISIFIFLFSILHCAMATMYCFCSLITKCFIGTEEIESSIIWGTHGVGNIRPTKWPKFLFIIVHIRIWVTSSTVPCWRWVYLMKVMPKARHGVRTKLDIQNVRCYHYH